MILRGSNQNQIKLVQCYWLSKMKRIGTTYLLGKEDREPSHNIHICSHYDQKWKIFSEFHPDYQEKVQNLVDWK